MHGQCSGALFLIFPTHHPLAPNSMWHGVTYRPSRLPKKPLVLWSFEPSPFCKARTRVLEGERGVGRFSWTGARIVQGHALLIICA